MTAPTGKPIWVDPCGGLLQDGQGTRSSDQDLLNGIIISAKNALLYAKQFSEEYVRQTFNHDFKLHHSTWSRTRYNWLPSEQEIPKGLGQKTPEHHLSDLARRRLDQSLLDSYRYLQTIAVGLEQVHHDKMRNNEEFSSEFETVQYKLRQVLCEVHNALAERTPDLAITDVDREVMAPEFRYMTDDSYRHIRDWFIFRDFMNCLEYVIDVCEFFKTA